MLADIHESVTTLLYERGSIPASEIDIRFERPTRDWIERLTRPTVDFFLYHMEENVELRQTNFNMSRENGHAERKLPPRRIDLHYMVCAFATEESDEHQILWRVLATLMRHHELPAEVLSPELSGVHPAISTRTAQDESMNLLDLWSGLGANPHAALQYVITAPLDLNITVQAPLVLTRSARYLRLHDPALATEIAVHIGGVVRRKDGSSVSGARVLLEGSASDGGITSTDGEYTLPGVTEGKIRLRVIPPKGKEVVVDFDVPSDSYDITLK